jgi:hypothetical protein
MTSLQYDENQSPEGSNPPSEMTFRPASNIQKTIDSVQRKHSCTASSSQQELSSNPFHSVPVSTRASYLVSHFSTRLAILAKFLAVSVDNCRTLKHTTSTSLISLSQSHIISHSTQPDL